MAGITKQTWLNGTAGSTERCPPTRSIISSTRLLIGSPGFPAAGHVVVKHRVNAIALAPAENIRRDSDLFIEGVQSPEFQERTQAAMKRGFQTREAEMDLEKLVK
jgi:hypothetical protein